jgi:hypothetical protein
MLGLRRESDCRHQLNAYVTAVSPRSTLRPVFLLLPYARGQTGDIDRPDQDHDEGAQDAKLDHRCPKE